MSEPTAVGWAVQPPPPPARRNVVPAVLAAVIGLLILVGGITTVALRATAGAATGAGSPEAAAEGLVAAVAAQDTAKIAELVTPTEARLVQVHGTRALDLVKQELGQGGGQVTADGVRFRVIGPTGDAALVELAEGRFGVPAGGGQLSLPASEVNKRLSDATEGKLSSVRLVAVADGNRWRIGPMASAAYTWLTAAGVDVDDVSTLVSGPAADGAATPEAAVEGVVAAVTDGDLDRAISLLAPDEARVLGGVRPHLAALAAREPGMFADPHAKWLAGLPGGTAPDIEVSGLTLATEPVADGVVRVRVTGGTVTGPDGKASKVDPADDETTVIAVEQDGLWYPSLLFSQIDKALAEAP
jgi:hypothetical protein